MKKRWFRPGAVLVAAAAFGCDAENTFRVVEDAVVSVFVSPATPTVSVGATVQLTAVPRDSMGNTVAGASVTWTSSDTDVAVVTKQGIVRGKSGGATQISARAAGRTGNAQVTVTDPSRAVARLILTPAQDTLDALGATLQLAAQLSDSLGTPVSGTVNWNSSNTAVATVGGQGNVTAISSGTVQITASAACCSAADTAVLTVRQVVTSIAVTPSSPAIGVGGSVQLSATARDANGHLVAGAATTWTSSNAAVATVNGSGGVQGLSAGTATITATSQGVSGAATVTVSSTGSNPVARVVVTPSADTLNALGASVQLTAQMLDSLGSQVTGPGMTWSSLNNSIAGVDSMGKVTAKAIGIALITATVACCNAADTVSMTVQQVVASIAVSPLTPTVNVGSSVQLTAVPQDANGNPVSGATVSWSSSNTGVATVNGSGTVQAVSSGSATITAASQGKTGTSSVTVPGSSTATVIRILLSPSSTTLYPNQQQPFTAAADMSDGSRDNSIAVTYSATGGTVTSAGLYTAGNSTGTYRVIAAHTGSSKADTSSISIQNPPTPGTFPAQYSLSRPLLANNPGALLGGDDWQGMTTAGLRGHGFNLQPGGDASLVSVVHGPSGAKRAEIVTDPVFGRAARVWITDASDGNAQTVRYGSGWSGKDKVWYRVLMKFRDGFDGHNDGSSAPAHKLIFGGMMRWLTMYNKTALQGGAEFHSSIGGTQRNLPGAPTHTGAFFNPNIDTNEPMYGSNGIEEWYEIIFYEERISASHFRARMWIRRVSNNDVVMSSPIQIVRNDGTPVKVGNEWIGASVPAGSSGGIQLGVNRNAPLPSGQTTWLMWGPWEAIDGSRISDPYGLANDML